jgi:hypothetical protein
MRRLWFFLLPSLGIAGTPAVPAGDPHDLVSQAVAAESENRKRAANYLFREAIYYRESDPQGAMALRLWSTYEVTFLQGEPFHRLVALDGRPLAPEKAAEEQKRMEQVAAYRRKTPIEQRRKKQSAAEGRRFRIDSRLVDEWHEASLVGEDIIDGRRAWILETRPRHDAPRPKSRAEWTLAQQCKYWVDEETLHPIRLETVQLYDWEGVPKASVTETRWTRVDDVWLVSRITTDNSIQRGKSQVRTETDQQYSNYHKFGSETIITYETFGPQ